MAQPTLVLKNQEDLFPIENHAQLAHALECLFNKFGDHAAADGQFVFKRRSDRRILRLMADDSHSPVDKRIQRALDFIHTHYEENITLEDIANAAFLSTYHFCRRFRKETGISCFQYLNRFRLAKAKELLDTTDFSITRVCYDVGFNSVTHCGRVFKQYEGCTPSAYRKAGTAITAKSVEKKASGVEHFSQGPAILFPT